MQILRKPLTEPNLACLQHNTTIAAFPTFKIKLPQCNHDRCPPNLHAAAIYSASTRLLGPDICPSSPIGQQAIRSAGPSVLVCNPFPPPRDKEQLHYNSMQYFIRVETRWLSTSNIACLLPIRPSSLCGESPNRRSLRRQPLRPRQYSYRTASVSYQKA
ncbi:hypothetical protein CCHR01_09683 [Colletotrichum chrysophilum]|uniref:Uncharacterized protein n=1 Tax=Colletotrichum chrysophilum TaxID=1836956 RepID=A0AAD9AGF5_9PEZI|nr:hypothetical protein CCHR01_09683 [Colletotrichum chrysophilum]